MSTFKQVTTRDGKTITISTVRPEIDWKLLTDSIREVIILHLDGKKSKNDQALLIDLVDKLKHPEHWHDVEVQNAHHFIDRAINDLVDTIYENS